jgi:hypothetical protein
VVVSLVKRLSEAFRSLAQSKKWSVYQARGVRRRFPKTVYPGSGLKGIASLAKHPGFLPAPKLKT